MDQIQTLLNESQERTLKQLKDFFMVGFRTGKNRPELSEIDVDKMLEENLATVRRLMSTVK